MKIEWLGLSCFKITSGKGSLVLDPFTGVRGYGEVNTSAGQAFKSYNHGDHAFLDGVKLVPEEENPFTVTTLDSFHDDVGGAKRGPNTIHLVEAEGIRVAHLGDLGHLPGDELVKALLGVDILLLPVGGFYTIDAAAAKKVVELVKPKTVVPMHYRDGEYGHEPIGTLEDFMGLMEGVPTAKLAGNSFETPAPRGIVVPKFSK